MRPALTLSTTSTYCGITFQSVMRASEREKEADQVVASLNAASVSVLSVAAGFLA